MTILTSSPNVPRMLAAQVQCGGGRALVCLDETDRQVAFFLEVNNELVSVGMDAQAMLDLSEALTDAAGRCGNEPSASPVEIDLILP